MFFLGSHYLDYHLRMFQPPNQGVSAQTLPWSEDFDPAYAEGMVRAVLQLLNEAYFRTQLIGFDHPVARNNPDAPVIMVSNHSGMAMPWDAVAFVSALLHQFNFDQSKVCRILIAPVLNRLGVMHPFAIPDFWKKCGGVDATFRNFEHLMQHPFANVLVYPEGVKGIGKGFNYRYRIQRLATSFVRMSIKYRTDIVPFATVNAEYINPWMYSVGWVNRLVQRISGLPFLPLGLLTPLLLLQPWLFYLAFPAKLTFVMGKRIRISDWVDKPLEDFSESEIMAIRDRVYEQMQEELRQAVTEYGKRPFAWREFFGALRSSWRQFPLWLPFGWPFLFTAYEQSCRNDNPLQQAPASGWKTVWSTLRRRPFLAWYFVPVIGWIPIIIRSLRLQKKATGM